MRVIRIDDNDWRIEANSVDMRDLAFAVYSTLALATRTGNEEAVAIYHALALDMSDNFVVDVRA